MIRKYPTLDLMRLVTDWDIPQWNAFLDKCVVTQDLEKLKATLYGLQAGMAMLAKKKLNTDHIDGVFLRMTRSIEITAKQIFRMKYPSIIDAGKVPGFDPKNHDIKKELIYKRKRDIEFQAFLKQSRF